jgi:hypothetical protein
MKLFFALAATVPVVMSPSLVMAQSYSGNWLVTITHSPSYSGKHCLTLTDNGAGSGGFPQHGGPAVIDAHTSNEYDGEFQIVNNTLMVGLEAGGGEGEGPQPFAFAAPAANGTIRKGIFQDWSVGYLDNEGALTFKKGRC